MLTDVAVVVAEPVPAFELGIVSEIFGLPRIDPSLPRYRYAVCAETRTEMRTSTGFTVIPTDDLTRLRTADLIIVTGASPPVPDPAPKTLAALREAADRGATVAAVCTGAFVVAAAGLLDGRKATTHWAYAKDLARRGITIDPDSIYVLDGPIATSAGASAAIDLCLHLIRREHGADIANRVARELVVPAHRSGGQAQFSRMPVADSNRPGTDGLATLLDWAADHLADDLSVQALAQRAAMSTRTFIRRFTDATGATPAAWVREQRVRRAEQLLERDNTTVAAIARRTGFGSPDTLRRQFRRVRGISPEAYRAAFHQAP
ncbi:GlxA family transcriptional regulator [Winogradskya humida]|uniref:Transcription regulator, AraC family protein n=1 Tax=Winogradskya humida TaxID=113566 RepID=A0ABQ3ZLM6_9ACTN|nr:helix-turn-helix domain-containing protein [Actinoplanes humidus]GIE19486.1 putative transcription regulator, AraC family protein [Actinoplanes humidus]